MEDDDNERGRRKFSAAPVLELRTYYGHIQEALRGKISDAGRNFIQERIWHLPEHVRENFISNKELLEFKADELLQKITRYEHVLRESGVRVPQWKEDPRPGLALIKKTSNAIANTTAKKAQNHTPLAPKVVRPANPDPQIKPETTSGSNPAKPLAPLTTQKPAKVPAAVRPKPVRVKVAPPAAVAAPDDAHEQTAAPPPLAAGEPTPRRAAIPEAKPPAPMRAAITKKTGQVVPKLANAWYQAACELYRESTPNAEISIEQRCELYERYGKAHRELINRAGRERNLDLESDDVLAQIRKDAGEDDIGLCVVSAFERVASGFCYRGGQEYAQSGAHDVMELVA